MIQRSGDTCSKGGPELLKSRMSTIRLSFLAAAIAVAGPVLGVAGTASAVPGKGSAPAPKPAPAALAGISCTSATFCMAVGGASATMPAQVAAEDWTGAWHRLSIGKPGGVSNVSLSAVSCPSAAECVAVGWGTIKKGSLVPIAETWTRSRGWGARPARGARGRRGLHAQCHLVPVHQLVLRGRGGGSVRHDRRRPAAAGRAVDPAWRLDAREAYRRRAARRGTR